MSSLPDQLPRWKTSNIFSGLEADDYRAAFAQFEAQLTELETWFDTHSIRGGASAPADTARLAEVLKGTIERLNADALAYGTLDAFVYAFLSTNSYDAVAARETSKLEILGARRQKLDVRFQAWVGSLAAQIEEAIEADPELRSHAFFLRETARLSRYLMSEELEALAADLTLDGATAFGKLQGSVTSQLKVPFERDGKAELLPITVVHNLCFDPDRSVRERAYRAEIEGWHSVRTTVAACLNAVKGTALTLANRRGRASVLDESLDHDHIDRRTLDAMLGAIRDALPTFRRYFRAKAAKLGLKQLSWWDLFAPVGKAHKRFTWQEARQLIVDKFANFDADLSDFARRAFDEQWIDAEPRDGKRGGAFCMEVISVEESRVLANFDGSFDQTSTLAHELGHAYHNHCQRGLEPLRRGSPMALAETASIFCETLIAEAALEEATPAEQLTILETQLCGAAQVCVDILSRFTFESALFKRRRESELSPDELCELMLDAQRQTYGDAIDPETYHRYMWLWKPHYYDYDHNYYNFPYAFGHLFSLGLYARFREEGRPFVPKYQQLLRSTNLDYAAPLAARFGIDITTPTFWHASLQIITNQLTRFESLPNT